MFIRAAAVFLLLLLSSIIHSQDILRGKVYHATTDSALGGVSVININSHLTVFSDQKGLYSITAKDGDKVVFITAGFEPDTVTIQHYMLYTSYDVTLKIKIISLKPVTIVARNYQTDSLERREYYRQLYEKREPGITGRNTPSGFGVSFSPLSHFSKESKQRRALRKRLARFEEEDYIDHSFPVELIKRITKLEGDSLRLFMYIYRPSFSFCRKTSSQDMLIYISDKLKEFRKPKSGTGN